MAKTPKQRIGIYAGTFDPITRGHIEIIHRAARLVDTLIIGVAKNSGKGPLFDTATRVKMVKREIEVLGNGKNIKVMPFETLLIDFAHEVGASVIVRGLRAVSDFEYEIQLAAMNYRMSPDIETIYLSATDGTQFISSSLVKEIARLGGDVNLFVSKAIATDLKSAFKGKKGRGKVKPVVRD
jgi:pantetheine-phosphate adenylyltransferase